MEEASLPQPFDVESWYAEVEPKSQSGPEAVTALMALLGKKHFYSRSLFAKGHPKEKAVNGGANAIKKDFAVTSPKWQPILEGHNDVGRRAYFVVNDGGHKWDDIEAKKGGCHNHFCEFDREHGFTPADALNTDWTSIGGVGFSKPGGIVYSGSYSPQLYFPLSESYEDPFRWYVNQCRLVQVLGADPACVDLSRLMRLPGFHNTDADGNKGRKALLLTCQPELKLTISEFEAALAKVEQACGMDPFDCIPVGQTVRTDRRPRLIAAFVSIFGDEIREDFETFFPANQKVKSTAGSWSDYLDSRPREEIEASFALIPPFVPGNGTFKGEEPVELADGRKVKIDYFRLLAGLKAAWVQRRLNLDALITLIQTRWEEVEPQWIVNTINGADGSIASGSYWHFAKICGYRLTKPLEEAKKGGGLSSVREGESVVDATRRDAASMTELFTELFELASRPIGKGTKDEMQAIKSRLSVCFGIRATDVDLRLIEMISAKHGYSLSLENETERVGQTFSGETAKKIPELIPGIVNYGSDCVMIGSPGSGKTTKAAVMSDCVTSGEHLATSTGPIRNTGKALYIATDGGNDALNILESYCVEAGVDVCKHRDEGTWIISAADTEKGLPSWVFSVRDIEWLIRELETHSKTDTPIRLVVIDTLIAVLEGAGINPGIGPVGACMRLMHEIGNRYGASIVWLHHTTKDGAMVAGHADITRNASSVLYLTRTDKLDEEGKEITELFVDKHRGAKEKRKEHFVLPPKEGIALARFPDIQKQHGNRLLLEIFHECGEAVSPTILSENLGDLNLTRKQVRTALSTMRNDHKWCDSSNGKWFLTPAGTERAQEIQNFLDAQAKEDEEFWNEPQSSEAA